MIATTIHTTNPSNHGPSTAACTIRATIMLGTIAAVKYNMTPQNSRAVGRHASQPSGFTYAQQGPMRGSTRGMTATHCGYGPGMAEAHSTAQSGEVFDSGMDFFGSIVARLGPDDWDHPSPNEGWTARDTLGHLGTSMQMGISLLRGEQPSWPDAERPGDLVEGDPADWWGAIAGEATAALEGADLDLEMDTPMGRRTVADRLAFPAIDLYVHGWDLATAAGFGAEIPDSVIAFAHAYIDPFPEEMVRGDAGAFGPEIEPPPDATPTEAFIAWTGRNPR